MPESVHPGMHLSDHDRPTKYVGTSHDQVLDKSVGKAVGLTTRESVELFQEAVDTARAEYQRLNSEAAGEALKPKLTVDLRNTWLGQLSKEVVAIIKQDVERLQLSYTSLSHIAYEFSQCAALKYLNLRGNMLKEFPKAIFGLPQLEILDLSGNGLSEVPDEIGSLTALRVFSVQNNDLQDLPTTLLTISTLRMLKVTENPFNRNLSRVIKGSEDVQDHNERDTILTRKILNYMRNNVTPRDSGEDSTDDGPLETPRALSRFPVQPQYSHSTSGSESASDLRSPLIAKPLLPTRSHTRVPSSQYNALQMATPRRPGLAPLALGNERNRSNSESIIQSTHNNRTKRNGLIGKKHSDLGVLDETRSNRNSHHFRGQSHGSALRTGVRVADNSLYASQSGGEYQRAVLVRRLASLPEKKRDFQPTDHLIGSAKGALYSVNMIHPIASTLASVIKDGKPKRSSVERDFHSALMHIERLDQELFRLDSISNDGGKPELQFRRAVVQATHDCVVAHQHVTAQLLRVARHLVKECDQRYVRTFMLTFYGSMNEMINASKTLGVGASINRPPKNSIQRVSTINEVPSEGEHTYISDRSMTPTQRRKPERRLKPGSKPQQPISHINLAPVSAQNVVPLYANGRSRSNSRARHFPSSASSSVVNTPRSGESFSSANLVARSRSSSINFTAEQARAEKQEAAQFEKIFYILLKSVEEGHGIVSHLHSEFFQALGAADKLYANTRVRDHWAILTNSTMHCLGLTEALKASLSNVMLNDREARNVRDFWRLTKSYLDSHGNLLVVIREAIKTNLVESSLRYQLRPVHTSIREITRLIATSPWSRLTFDVDPQATPQATPQVQTQLPALNGYQHRTRGSGGSSTGGTSPYPANVPATPLSAALGPAAQATVPAPPPTPAGNMPPTPSTASFERSFEGDIFQRADTYQSLQQTMIPRRQAL